MGTTSNTIGLGADLQVKRPRKISTSHEFLVYKPTLRGTGHLVELNAKRANPKKRPWGLWGAVTAAAGSFGLFTYEGARGFHDWNTVMVAIVVLGFALMAARFGPMDSMEDTHLATFNLAERKLEVKGAEGQLDFSEIDELVYAMVKYPIAENERKVKVDAFSLLVRTPEGDLLPIIEASPDKNAVFNTARAVSQWTGHEITHVGLGVRRS